MLSLRVLLPPVRMSLFQECSHHRPVGRPLRQESCCRPPEQSHEGSHSNGVVSEDSVCDTCTNDAPPGNTDRLTSMCHTFSDAPSKEQYLMLTPALGGIQASHTLSLPPSLSPLSLSLSHTHTHSPAIHNKQVTHLPMKPTYNT